MVNKWIKRMEQLTMAIPNYQACMLPLLDLCKDSREHSMTELTDMLAKHFNLSEMEYATLLPSGKG